MRFLAIAATFVASAALGQSALPATQPTAANAPIAPIAATPAMVRGHHAYVSYNFGLLQVRADNSSLNVILRDIARITGMQIHGGVADQRVFGNYGPSEPGAVLATLLDGTGVNMFLKESSNGEPASLTLTPRTPGEAPATPDSPQYDEEARAEALSGPAQPSSQPAAIPVQPAQTTPSPSTPPSVPQPWNNVNGSPSNTSPTVSTLPTTNSVPLDSLPTPSTTPPSTGIVDAPNPPPAGTTVNPAATSVTSVTTQPDGTTTSTTVTAPNGVKTPEQIYQQLLQMQKAQQAAGSGTATTNNPQ